MQKTIQNNARLEFEAIWREAQETKQPRSILSDTLSNAITKLDEELQNTDLWNQIEFRNSVLSEALPNLLLEQIGMEKIMERVSPNNTIKAGCRLMKMKGTRKLPPRHLRKLPRQPLRIPVRCVG